MTKEPIFGTLLFVYSFGTSILNIILLKTLKRWNGTYNGPLEALYVAVFTLGEHSK
jgi:hypothetical protein